jgi:hypothetical protein
LGKFTEQQFGIEILFAEQVEIDGLTMAEPQTKRRAARQVKAAVARGL